MNGLFEAWRWGMKWMLIIFIPLYVLISPILAVTYWIKPFPYVQVELDSEYPDQITICVGRSQVREKIGNEYLEESGSFILIPRVFTQPAVVSINVLVNENGLRFEHSESIAALIIFIVIYLLAVGFSLKYSYPRFKRIKEQIQNP